MEKPGQGPPHPEVFVQDEVKSPLRRIVEDFITVVCWGIYLYLLLPLFTLVLWVFGVQTIYDQIIGQKGYEELSRLLANGGITVLVIFLIVSAGRTTTTSGSCAAGRGVEDRSGSAATWRWRDSSARTSRPWRRIRKSQRLEIRVDGPFTGSPQGLTHRPGKADKREDPAQCGVFLRRLFKPDFPLSKNRCKSRPAVLWSATVATNLTNERKKRHFHDQTSPVHHHRIHRHDHRNRSRCRGLEATYG